MKTAMFFRLAVLLVFAANANVGAQCLYSLSTPFPYSGANGSVLVTATTNCSWTVTGLPEWIFLTSAETVTNSGTVLFTVVPNPTTNRNVTLTIAGEPFTISQEAEPFAPTVPTLTVSAFSSNQINLTWTASTDSGGSELAGYKIFRDAVQIDTATGTNYSDTGLTPSTAYCYTVAAYDNAGNTSDESGSECATTASVIDETAPSTPTLTATAFSSTQINLSWSAATDTGGSGLAGYKLYRTGVQIATTSSTSYSDTPLTPETLYCYTISAYDNSGNTSAQSASTCSTTMSPPDTHAPTVPTLTANGVSSSQINLSWTVSTDTGGSGLAGYKLYRAGVQILTTTNTSYSDTGLNASTSYCYTVASYDNAGNTSPFSASKCATTVTPVDVIAPSVPTLTATANSSNKIDLSWTVSTDTGGSGLAGYKVYRTGVQIATTTATSYQNTGLLAGTQYCYTVLAYDNAGNASAQSSSQCATTTGAAPDTTAPTVPTLTATAVSSSQINLSWTTSTDSGGSGLAGYRLYRGGTLIAITTGTSYSNTGLAPNTQYCYAVAAYDRSANASANSATQCATTTGVPDTTAPTVPTLTATAFSSNQVNLSWTTSTDSGGSGLAGYKLFRGGVQIATTSGTTYVNTGLTPNTSYCYTVLAYDNAGNNSAQSSSQCATTPTATDTIAPSVPTLTATAFSSSQNNLSWTVASDSGGSGLAGYKVYRAGVQIATTTSNSYSDTGRSPGTQYCYTVASYDNAGNNSAQSSSQCATTLADTVAPSVPVLTATAVSFSQINLSWTAATDTGGAGLAGYKVYRAGVQIATTTATSYSNTGLSASTQYCYTVASYDNSGNTSAQSSSRCATTAAVPDTTAPSVPTLTATAVSSSQINLSWTASTDTGGSGLAGYKLFRAGIQIATLTGISYSDTGRSPSTQYCYTVLAYDNSGNASAQSSSQCATTAAAPDATAPTVPTLTVTVISSSQINLSWTASTDSGGSGLAGYKIYKSGVQIHTTTSTSYSDTGLSPSTQYCYTVAGYDNAGNTSAQSTSQCGTTSAAADTTPPTVPTLTATAASSTQVNLSWTASTDTGGSGLSGYKVFRAGSQIATTSGTSYSDAGLSPSTSYCYTVASYDNAGNTSSQSSTQCATTTAAPDTTAPSVPVVTATVISSSQINLGWPASTDAGGSGLAGYKIYRGGVQIATTSSTSYSDIGLSANTTYCYTVASYDNAGNTSAQSTSACGTTPSVPTGWVKGFGGSLNDGCASVVIGSGGNIFAVGTFSATMSITLLGGVTTNLTSEGSTDMFILKARQDGAIEWIARYGGTGGSAPKVISLDSGGNIYIGGTFTGAKNFGGSTVTSAGNVDGFVAKYSSTGAFVWAKTIGGVSNDYVNDIALDPTGQNVIATGNFVGTATFFGTSNLTADIGGPDSFLLKCSTSNGALVWVKNFTNQDYDSGAVVCLDSTGNIYLAGIFRTSINLGGGNFTSAGIDFLYDLYIAKFAPSGSVAPTTPIWSRRAGGVGADIVYAGALDASGHLSLAGSFTKLTTDVGTGTLTGTGVASDIFVVKYASQTGTALWSQAFKCSYSGVATAVAVDGQSNVIVVGAFNGTCTFPLGAGTQTARTSAGADDGFAVRCDGTTGYVRSTLGVPNILTFGGTATDSVYDVAVDTSGGGAGIPVMGGSYQNATFPGNVFVPSSGFSDAFLLRRDF